MQPVYLPDRYCSGIKVISFEKVPLEYLEIKGEMSIVQSWHEGRSHLCLNRCLCKVTEAQVSVGTQHNI